MNYIFVCASYKKKNKKKLTPNTIIRFNATTMFHRVYFGSVGFCSVEKFRARERKQKRQYNMIQTAECIQSFRWCMETCAGHVCVCASRVTAQSGRHREKSRLANTDKLISESQQAHEWLQYLSAQGAQECWIH